MRFDRPSVDRESVVKSVVFTCTQAFSDEIETVRVIPNSLNFIALAGFGWCIDATDVATGKMSSYPIDKIEPAGKMQTALDVYLILSEFGAILPPILSEFIARRSSNA